MAPRSLLYPLIGERIHGPIGHGVDVLCTVGTLCGVATSLGLGAVQINAGLNKLFEVPQAQWVQLTLIGAITCAATISVVSGLERGIQTLSRINVALLCLVLLFVLVAGPTVFILDLFTSGLGYYLQKLPETSLWVQPGVAGGWQADWTLFYWSWWISWSPFVGIFVARISEGRTIREFVGAALLVPTLLGFLWFAALGGTGLHLEQTVGGIAEAAQDEAKGSSLFAVLGHLPFHEVTWVVAVVLIVLFFVTSSDSGSFVDDMVTSGGDPNPPKAQRLFWALSEGAVAATLLAAGTSDEGGKAGLRALRTASLTTGLPMALFLLSACWGLSRALSRRERGSRGRRDDA
jgi:choline/glycine/proline betaine transport protein